MEIKFLNKIADKTDFMLAPMGPAHRPKWSHSNPPPTLKNALTTGDQKKLSKAFYKLILSQRVVFLSDAEKNRLTGVDTKYTWLKNTLNAYFKLGLSSKKNDSDIEFKIFEDRIWAVDKSSQKPLAATIEKYVAKSSFLETVKSLFDFRKIQNLNLHGQCKNLF